MRENFPMQALGNSRFLKRFTGKESRRGWQNPSMHRTGIGELRANPDGKETAARMEGCGGGRRNQAAVPLCALLAPSFKKW